MVQSLDDARRRRPPGAGGGSRVPPHNLEAEESLLGAMLLSRDAIVSAVELQMGADDFYKPAHGHIYDAISSIYAQGEPADPVTVAEELRRAGLLEAVGGQPAIVALQANTPAIGNAARYARIVEEHALLRKLISVAGNIAEMGYSVPDDVSAAIDEAEALVFDVAQRRVTDSLAPLRDLLERQLDRIEALFERGEDITGVPTGYLDLDHQLAGLQPSNLVIVGGRPGTGKALALDTPLPTPTGWTTMGEVQPGDELLDERGRPCRVTFATPVQLGRPCYEVAFDDGSLLVADADHQWLAYGHPACESFREGAYRAQGPAPNPTALRRQPRVVTTHDMVEEGIHCPDGRPNWYVPVTEALDLPEQVLPLDPYLLGVRLGEEPAGSAAVASADPEIVEAFSSHGYRAVPAAPAGAATTDRIGLEHPTSRPWPQTLPDGAVVARQAPVSAGEPLAAAGRDVTRSWDSIRCDSVRAVLDGAVGRPHTCRDGVPPSLAKAWGDLQLLPERHIPAPYLRASRRQRLALLQGILDTAGTVAPGGQVEVCLADRLLLGQVRELACSLGHRPGLVREHVIPLPDGRSTTAWRLGWVPGGEVFRPPRTAARLAASRRRVASGGAAGRAVTGIRRVGTVPVRCITVDSPNQLYLAGESMIPTHNTSFALGIVTHAALESRTPVLLFSLEMSHLELTQRMLCAEARVDATRMRNGRLLESDWPKISHAVGRLAEAPVFIDDNPHLTVMEIRAKARRLKSRSGLGLIVIDYLQLMAGRASAENRQVEVSEISRGLKILARELEVPVIALSQLSRSLETRADKRPQLADLRESGCVPASTMVMRADTGEEVSVGSLVLSQEQALVWSVDEHQRLVPARLTNAFPTGIKPVFRLRLASGRSVEASANHPFLALDGWARLDLLSAGSVIATPRRIPQALHPSDTHWPDDELALLAHLIGDGQMGEACMYANADPANKALVERLARDLFGISATSTKHGNTWQVRFPSPYRLTHGVNHPMRNWLEPHGLWKSRPWTKFVPPSVFGLGDTKIALFLHHLWASGGSITITRNGGAPVVSTCYSSTSERLALDVQRLLLRLGIRSTIGTSRKVRSGTARDGIQHSRPGYSVQIQGAADQAAFLRLVGCHGGRGARIPEALEILDGINENPNLDLVPWPIASRMAAAATAAGVTHGRDRLAPMATLVESEELLDIATSDLYWDEIVEIVPLGDQPTFDVTVEENHNFLANGIVAHNSLEQDADVVIFLYRDEVYNRDSPDRGTAEVIVAKHRNGPTGMTQLAFLDHYTRFANMAKGV